jgi:hypothetical protein
MFGAIINIRWRVAWSSQGPPQVSYKGTNPTHEGSAHMT